MLPLETKIPKEKAAKTASSGVLMIARINYSTLKRADPDA